jgi:hypothetical protein
MKLFTAFYARFFKTGTFAFSIFCAMQGSAQFTPGNVTVLQAGDGSSALVNTGNVIVLKEFSPAGAVTYSMAVPSTSASALVISGSASSEGFLSLSADNKYLVFGGYAKSLPNSTALSGATASSINRGIALVGGAGLSSYSLIASTSFFTGANVRGAAAANSSNCWGAGGNQGANYFGSAAAPVTVQNTKTNLRAIAVFNGQLYCSSQVASGTPTDIGIYAIGSGTPVTNGQQVTTVINTGTGSQPAQFYFNSAGTVCYVADQRSAANGGGIQKWMLGAGTWSLAYTLPTGTTAVGATGVVADFSGSAPNIYATSNEPNTNHLIAIADNGAASTATILATAGTSGTVFKGLAFSPCSPPAVNAGSSASVICAGQTLTLNAFASGSAPLSYFWAGAGPVQNVNAASPVITAIVSGLYTVTAGNNCGSASATVSITVNPLPSMSVNSVIVCAGQPATLTATGASSYSWSTGSTASSIIVTPGTSSNYTVSGNATNGCVLTTTTQVITASFPTVSVNSGTLCSANSIVLTAAGANSYTWSNGTYTNSITATPSVSTTYTVTASLLGCPSTASAVATITVIPSPALTIAGASLTCQGTAVQLTVSGAGSYSWSSGATTNTVSLMPTVTTVYSVSGTDAGSGCSTTVTTTVAVGSPTLTIVATPSVYCISFAPVSIAVSGANTYSWNNGATGSVIVVMPITTTVYTVTGFIGPGCSSTMQYTLEAAYCEGLAVNSPDAAGFFVYPNPATEQVTVAFNNSSSVCITDVSGQVVVYTTTASTPTLDIDVSTFSKGLYFIIVKTKDSSIRKKLLIH